ncbi:hypothetical protein HMPREF1146_1589 [Prevotella sp. MSX73]|uniref:Uncharacterized protein n=1 Tax=Segatella buccae ATCC 33574 TaxID=873513 RepID=E6K6F6_9BACT|nr:hypothetical protein HMPREF6485_1192 [Segatella buccae ATCC 33574]EJP31905.1 hypothetical protein HMPREF1146_1589 [Prevotella sp. MSX73]
MKFKNSKNQAFKCSSIERFKASENNLLRLLGDFAPKSQGDSPWWFS